MTAFKDPILQYVAEQATALPFVSASVVEQLSRLATRSARTIVFVASGTSLNAAMAMAPAFRVTGAHVEVLNPGAFLKRNWQHHADLLCVFISQTGTSSTTIAALEWAEGHGLDAVALTAEKDSLFAKAARTPLIMPVGPEPVGPKTKGYTATLVALVRVLEWLGGTLPAAELPDLGTMLGATEQAAIELATELGAGGFIGVFGEDRHFGTALEASLKITEITGLASAAFPIEEALHGRLHGADEKGCCIAIAATDAEREETAHMADVMGGLEVPVRLLNLTDIPTAYDWVHIPGGDAPLDTISAILPFQFLAAHIALVNGRAPHLMRFQGLSQKLGIKTLSVA